MSDAAPPDVRWSVDVPAAGGGSLTATKDGLLASGPGWLGLYSFSGDLIWMHPEASTSWAMMLDDHTLGEIEERRHVVIRDIATGRVQHRWPAPEASLLGPTPWGDVIFLQAEDPQNRVMRCVTRDGRPKWSVPLGRGRPVHPWPAFGVSDVVAIAHDGAVRAYDETGTARWAVSRDGMRAPAASEDRVRLFGNAVRVDRDRVVVELEWDEGGGIVEIDGRGPSMRRLGEYPVLRPPVTTMPGAGDDYLLAGSVGQKDVGHMDYVYPLRVLRPDGSVVWDHHLPAEFFSLDVVPGGGFVVSGSPTVKVWREYGQWQDLSDRTYARLIDADGDEVWTWYAPGLVTHSATAGPDGAVYVGSEGRLFCLATAAPGAVAPPPVPLARTSHEAQLYLDLTPCVCGEARFARTGTVVELPDGALGRRYAGTCPSCGRERTYLFRLPEVSQDVSTADEIVYGLGTQPSELLDPAEWLLVADRYAGAVPAHPERLDGDARRIARTRLLAAVAAVREAEKFLPETGDRIPDAAVRSDVGRRWLAQEPGRFEAVRMELRREAYERALREMDPPPRPVFDAGRAQRLAAPGTGQDPATGLYLDSAAGALAALQQVRDAVVTGWAADAAERDRRLGRVTQAYERWRAERGIDDRAWGADAWAIPREALPPADAAWAMVRAAREAAGLDPLTGTARPSPIGH